MTQQGRVIGQMFGLWGCLAAAAIGHAATPEEEFFEKQVRPVLIEHCLKCHGPKDFKGGLRVDSRTALLKGGDSGPALMPGDPEQSLLIEAVRYEPESYQMPPTGKLPADAIAAITEWVKQGAVWPGGDTAVEPSGAEFNLQERAQHWSFQPLQIVAPPAIEHPEWAANPVDRFIAARLQANGLQPSSAASRATLLRRASYDLIGLPPTPEEIVEFVADTRPDAWERVIDRLLASPHYGERWGRHWLDLVRFAETYGHEFDYDIPFAWPYRDYIIRAFNEDLPYDALIREHLAGDLLPEPRRQIATGTNESVIGTAFYWFSQGKHSPVDVRSEECDMVDNQLDVIGKTFQGLTIACSRCHDHKFDPIRQRDYYALAGFLQSSRQTVSDINPPEATQRAYAGLIDSSAEQATQLVAAALPGWKTFVDELPQRLLDPSPEAEAWRQKILDGAAADRAHVFHFWAHWAGAADLQEPISQWKELRQREAQNVVPPPVVYPPGVAVDRAGQPVSPWLSEGLAFETNPRTRWLFGNTSEAPLAGLLSPATWAHSGTVAGELRGYLRSPTFTITAPYLDYWISRQPGEGAPGRQNKVGQVHLIVDGFQLIRNPLYGHLTLNVEASAQPKWYRQDVQRFIGSRAYIEIEDVDTGDLVVDRIEANEGGPRPDTYNAILTKLVDEHEIHTAAQLTQVYQQAFQDALAKVQREVLYGASAVNGAHGAATADLVNWLVRYAPPPARTPVIEGVIAQRAAMKQQIPAPQWTMAITDGTAEDERLLVRGNPKKPGDPVSREFLEVLQPATQSGPLGGSSGAQGSGRLEWANCIADARNPLTARVLVNRLWQHHFGRGLVPTPDDFGKMGQPPSHPELLDWLAGEFVQSGWSLKQMHRLMLTSATYQQSSQLVPSAMESDPENRWWHRMPVQRLEAEAIRDALLQLSGRLDDRLYGPSIAPFLTPFMEGRGRPGHSGPLDGDGRRSLYISVRRNFLSPMFLAFDFPTPFTTMGKRSSSNVPAQALTLMNNPLVVQQTQLWADQICATESSPEGRLRRLYHEAFGREPTVEELQAGLAFIGPESAPAAWRDLAHVLVNVKEFVFID